MGQIRFFARKLADLPEEIDLLNNPAPDLSAGIEAWKKVASHSRITSVLKLAGNLVESDADRLDADPDLLNTPGGIVDLRTGEVSAHDQAKAMTMITRGSYIPGYTHPDLEKALTALPEPERAWLQRRIGQAITGHPTPDDVIPLLQGPGGNGKTTLVGDGMLSALGGYGHTASAKLLTASEKGSEHSTEMADLRGRRFVLGEELTEGQVLNITTLKRLTVAYITARFCRQDNFTFATTHSLFLTSNPVPRVVETDDGTWRRLLRLCFRRSFRASEAEFVADTDTVAELGLKQRINAGADGQYDAALTWAVDGALAWYANPETALLPTAQIKADTLEWRAGADRILGYWIDNLVADPDGKILVSVLLDDFNSWMTENGHHPWARETFTPKFAAHVDTVRSKVVRVKPRNLDGLSRSRRACTNLTTPARPVGLGRSQVPHRG